MRRFSALAVIFLMLCAGSILLMRSCGGDRANDIPPMPTPEPLAEPTPTPDPMSLLATPEPIPTPVPTPSYEGKVWTTDGVNLRTGPGTDFDIFNAVDKGTELQRTGTTDNNWSRVLFENVGYYVDSSYLTTTPPATEEGEEGSAGSEEVSTAAPVVSGDFPTEGSFESNTGVALNLRVDWNLVTGSDGSRTLNLSATLLSCTLEAAAYADDLCFKVGNDTFYVTSKGVSVSSPSIVETELGSCSATVESVGVPVTVSWRFNGSYSGQQIEYVTATQTLTFGS